MQALDKALAQVGRVVLGKEEQLKLALTCMLANGHLLIEDLPGMGKTTLAHALARVFKLEYRRIFSASPYSIPTHSSFPFVKGRFSPSYCWPMKSIGPHRKRRVRCLKPWKSDR